MGQHGNFSDPYEDCGPASLVACRFRATGELWMPDEIRDAMYYDGYKGYTTTDKLAKFARDVWGWGATDTSLSFLAAYDLIKQHTAYDAYIITLTKEPPDRYGPNGYYHFTVITGWSETAVIRHNVMGGVRQELAWSTFAQRFQGWVILLTPT